MNPKHLEQQVLTSKLFEIHDIGVTSRNTSDAPRLNIPASILMDMLQFSVFYSLNDVNRHPAASSVLFYSQAKK